MSSLTTKLVSGLLMAASLTFLPYNIQGKPKTIHEEERIIEIIDKHGKTREEEFITGIYLEESKNKLFFALIGGENFDNQPIKNNELQFQYVLMEPPDVYIIHPKQIKISGLEESAQIITNRKNKRLKLRPKEGSIEEILQNGFKQGAATSFNSFVPGSGEALKAMIDFAASIRNKNTRKSLERITAEDYIITEIPKYVPNLITVYNETARIYEISFDTSKIKGEVPLIFWARPHFKYISGKRDGLEDIIKVFNLEGGVEEIISIPEGLVERKYLNGTGNVLVSKKAMRIRGVYHTKKERIHLYEDGLKLDDDVPNMISIFNGEHKITRLPGRIGPLKYKTFGEVFLLADKEMVKLMQGTSYIKWELKELPGPPYDISDSSMDGIYYNKDPEKRFQQTSIPGVYGIRLKFSGQETTTNDWTKDVIFYNNSNGVSIISFGLK